MVVRYPSICNALPHLILCLDNGADKVHRIAFKNRVLGEHSGLLKHKNAIGGWKGSALYPNNDMEA